MDSKISTGYVFGIGLVLTAFVPYLATGVAEIAVGHASAGASVLMASALLHILKSEHIVGAST